MMRQLVSVSNQLDRKADLHHLHGLLVVVNAIDMIASVIAGSCRFGTIHNELAAVTPSSSLDERSWMVSYMVYYLLVRHECVT